MTKYFQIHYESIALLGPMLCPSITDWTVDGLERGLELEQIEKFKFFQQLKQHGMEQSFKTLYEELHIIFGMNMEYHIIKGRNYC